MQRVLLDTQVFIWLAQGHERLSRAAYARIHSEDKLFISYASLWEMAIKLKVGKLTLRFPL